MQSTLSVIDEIKVERSDSAESFVSTGSESGIESISDDDGTASEDVDYNVSTWSYQPVMHNVMYNSYGPFAYRRPLEYPYKYPIDNHAGPMLISNGLNTFCGVCGTCITLEDEQNLMWTSSGYPSYGHSVPVQHDDAGNKEFQKLQAPHAGIDGNYATKRDFGIMPKVGWTGLYRVVMCSTRLAPKRGMSRYRVSGVGRYHLWDSDPEARQLHLKVEYRGNWEPVFTVPWKKDDLLVDRQHFYNKIISSHQKDITKSKPPVKRVNVYPAHFHDSDHQHLFPHGFPIHAHCWTLAEHVIGRDLLEKNLELFIRTLQQRWEDENIIQDSRQLIEWIIDRCRSSSASEYDSDRYLVAIRDPITVFEVEEIIAESAKKYSLLKERQGNPPAIVTANYALFTIPYEVWSGIFDCLHYSELVKFLSVTRIRMPQSYWWSRAPKDIVWELNEIDWKTTPIDWQDLCLRAERLCDESLGLINRQRICRILEDVGTKLAFFTDVEVPSNPVRESAPTRTSPSTETLDVASTFQDLGSDTEEELLLAEWDDEYARRDYLDAAEWDGN